MSLQSRPQPNRSDGKGRQCAAQGWRGLLRLPKVRRLVSNRLAGGFLCGAFCFVNCYHLPAILLKLALKTTCRGRCNRGATCKYSHNIAFLAAPGFLGSALSSDGGPMAAQAPGAGLPGAGAQLTGIPMGGAPAFVAMAGLPNMAPRLANALSADQATLNHVLAAAGPGAVNQMLAAQAAMQQSSGLAQVAAEAAAAVAEG